MQCGLEWEDRRNNKWQTNDDTAIADMYSCRLAVGPSHFIRMC